MAKTSKVVKNNKRLETVGFYQDRRKELLKVIKDPDSSYDEKEKHKKRLQKCQETHQQPDIEIDARLLEDQEEH